MRATLTRRALPLGAAIAAALLLPALLFPTRSGAAPADTGSVALERQLHALINRERRAHGAPPVRLNTELSSVARAHSRDMRDRGFFAHLTPEGRTPLDRVRAARIAFTRVGENLAVDRDVETPHRTMMAEPPGQRNHRSTLLHPAYTDVGIGIETDGQWLYITQDFITAGTADNAAEWDASPSVARAESEGIGTALNALANRMAHLHTRLGRMALLAGDAAGAIVSFQSALRDDPRCAAAHAGLGEAYDALGKSEEARQAYAAAVAANPDDTASRLRLAVRLRMAGRPAEAAPHFRVLTRVQADNAEAWFGAAACAAATGQHEEARTLLRRGLALEASLRERARADGALAPLLE